MLPSLPNGYRKPVYKIDFKSELWWHYAGWQYGEPLKRSDDASWDDANTFFIALFELYKMGLTVQDVHFQDEVMDLMIDLLQQDSEAIDLDEILPELIGHGQDMVEPRQLMADILVFGSSSSCEGWVWDESFKKMQDADFCLNVTRTVLERMSGGQTKVLWDVRCQYHRHNKGGQKRHLARKDSGGNAATKE